MDWRERIVVDPHVRVGKSVVRGTRLGVDFIFELLANGWTHEEILSKYPRLIREDIQA